jgi:hypothetical protein
MNKLPDSLDVLLFCGAALVVWGIHLIYAPLAYVTAGSFLLTIGGLRLAAQRKGK